MDREFVRELFAPFGTIDIRRMFGGLSLSADGLTFAMIIRDQIHLKADAESIPLFEAEGCSPFQYEVRGRGVTVMSYWRIPERLYDNPDELAQWTHTALEVARRAAARKKPKKPRKPLG